MLNFIEQETEISMKPVVNSFKWVGGIFLFCLGVFQPPADAYTPILTSNDNLVRWNLDEIPRDQPNIIENSVEFFVDRAGTNDIPDNGDGTGGEFDILRFAFREWEAVPSSEMDFNDLKLTDQFFPTGTDLTNLVTFDPNNTTGLFPEGTGIIAITLLTYEDEEYNGQLDGNITDADLVFNDRDFDFSSGLDDDDKGGIAFGVPMHLLSVAVHEIGHVCGLGHAFHQYHVPGDPTNHVPTMFPYINPGDTQASELSSDDIAGITALYENEEYSRRINGSISGRVTKENPIPGEAPLPLFGINVIAYQDGIPVAGTISRTDGIYRILGVPAGTYILRAQVISPFNTNIVQPVELEVQSEYYEVAGSTDDASPITVHPGRRRFDFNFELRSDTAPDFFEPNDSFAQATSLSVDGPRLLFQFFDLGDEDWVQFEATTGQTYRLTTNNLNFFADPFMEVFESDGMTLISQNDDISFGQSNFAAQVTFEADQTGTHYVRLTDALGFFGFGTDFEFYIESVGETSPFDVNGDGVVDALDLLVYSANWGEMMESEKTEAVQVDEDLILGVIRSFRD